MDPNIRMIGMIESEGPDDLVFVPAGILIQLENKRFSVYSASAEHNRLRSVINRSNLEDLAEGIRWHNTEYRVTDLTSQMAQYGWTTVSAIPLVLRHLYQSQPRHLFFLKRFVEDY